MSTKGTIANLPVKCSNSIPVTLARFSLNLDHFTTFQILKMWVVGSEMSIEYTLMWEPYSYCIIRALIIQNLEKAR